MLYDVRRWLFVVGCVLLVVCCSLCIVRCLLIAVCSLVVRCSSLVVGGLLYVSVLAVRRALLAVCCG